MRSLERLVTAAIVGVLTVAAVTVFVLTGDPATVVYWLFIAAVACWGLAGNLFGGRGFQRQPVARGRVLAIVPVYNENLDGLYDTVQALLAQTVPCDVIIVDDGSASAVISLRHPRVRWVRQGNAGKRAAQIAALRLTRRGDYDFIFTVDSDSEPYINALEHLLRAMSDPEVWAATGWVYTRNYRDGWIARCADLDIGIAMVMNRGSRTLIGGVETMSGALALYRAELFWDHADEYLADKVTAGDDRWMTARALMRGKAVGVPEAVVETDMPNEVGKTFRQRVRWAKSNYIMAGFSIRSYKLPHLLPPFVTFVYIVVAPLTLAAAVGAVGYLLVTGAPLPRFPLTGLAIVLGATFAMRVGLCVLYLMRRQNMPRKQKVISLLAGATLLYVFGIFAIAVPKYWALFKLRDTRWSTRDSSATRPLTAGSTTVQPGNKYTDALRMGDTVIFAGDAIQQELARARQSSALSRQDRQQ